MYTDVYFTWSDWESNTESFKKQEQVFKYIKSVEKDKNIKCENFESDNTNWLF